MLREVTLKLPDWAYQYFADKWSKDERSLDSEFNLERYVSWEISEMVGNKRQKESLARADKGMAGGNQLKGILREGRRGRIFP